MAAAEAVVALGESERERERRRRAVAETVMEPCEDERGEREAPG